MKKLLIALISSGCLGFFACQHSWHFLLLRNILLLLLLLLFSLPGNVASFIYFFYWKPPFIFLILFSFDFLGHT